MTASKNDFCVKYSTVQQRKVQNTCICGTRSPLHSIEGATSCVVRFNEGMVDAAMHSIYGSYPGPRMELVHNFCLDENLMSHPLFYLHE